MKSHFSFEKHAEYVKAEMRKYISYERLVRYTKANTKIVVGWFVFYSVAYVGIVYIYMYHPDYFLESYYGRRAPFLIYSGPLFPMLIIIWESNRWDRENQDK